MRCLRRLGLPALVGLVVLVPGAARAQSTIAGTVLDTTGGVLPGVTVEASSPALIEKTRTAVTDGQGRYTLPELRPGVYTVTFALQGFAIVRREGIEVQASTNVPINVELQVGAVAETITVSGATPVVDVQEAAQRRVLARDVLDQLPTNRTTATVGALVPGLRMTAPMVGGMNSTIIQQYVRTRGKDARENTSQVEGMDVGWIRGTQDRGYDNFAMAQEIAVETNAAGAEVSGGGVRINLIPREGGNTFSSDTVFSGMIKSWQADNITPELREAGLPTPTTSDFMFDLNPSLGGRIVRDRVWFFASGRLNHADLLPAGATYFVPAPGNIGGVPGSEQGVNETYTDNFSFRVTVQVTQKSKLTVYRDQFWRYQSHFGGSVLQDWATVPETYGVGTQYLLPIKYTATLTNKLLLEAGWSHWGYDNTINLPQDGVLKPNGSPEWFANAARRDLVTGYLTVAGGNECCYRYIQPADVYQAAVSYVTGSHQLKAGFSHKHGYSQIITQENNGALEQQYRTGVPNSVSVAAHPSDAQSRVNHDAGIYVQDRWTFKRLTVNAGVRYEIFEGGSGATSSPAGRFVPARSTAKQQVWPTFTDWAPRFNVVYDLFGNAKTALKASAGKYVSTTGASQIGAYNPISITSETRNWFDCELLPGSSTTCSGRALATNGDNIAQDNEIAPSTNPRFGQAAELRADPELRREHSWDYSVGVQHEVIPRVSLTAMWYHTSNGNLWANQDAFYTVNDWTRFDIANPCLGDPKCGSANNAAATIPVFNLNAGTRTGDIVTRSSDLDKRIYNGFEISGQARLAGGTTIIAGFFTEHTVARTCDRNNPNQLRYCDQFGDLFQELGTTEAPPFRNEVKLSVSQPLPWSFLGSVSFLSYANAAPPTAASSFTSGLVTGTGAPIDYLGADFALPATLPGGVARTIPVTAGLVAPGTLYFDRWNQLDLSVKRTVRFGKYALTPSFELYNVLNSSVIVNALQTYGPTYLRPTSTLPGRLMRLGAQFRF
jgi:hypothetical protein